MGSLIQYKEKSPGISHPHGKPYVATQANVSIILGDSAQQEQPHGFVSKSRRGLGSSSSSAFEAFRTVISRLREALTKKDEEIDRLNAQAKEFKSKIKELEALLPQTEQSARIEIQTVSRQDTHTTDPKVKAVVEKLLSYKGKIEYQTAKGRAAKPVDEWIQSTFIDSKIMTVEELKLIPLWAYRQFNQRLYNAIFNKKRAKPR